MPLYLIPCATHLENPKSFLPESTSKCIERVEIFIVENVRSARRYIRRIFPSKSIDSLIWIPINKKGKTEDITWIKLCKEEKKNIGLLSEAGSPCIADPGYTVVALAHKNAIEVIPLVGPCFITLALSSSGLYGQAFSFVGYLPIPPKQLASSIQALERTSRRLKQTQIFIETPYRNFRTWKALLENTSPQTRISICTNLTLERGFSLCKTSQEWQKLDTPDFDRKPTVFLIQTQF